MHMPYLTLFTNGFTYRDCRTNFSSGFTPKAFPILFAHKAVEVFDQGFLSLDGLTSMNEEPHQP